MSSPAATSSQPTLLFIPDISGFTQFVNDTEITHSQHIIQEVLEELIDANEIDLTVSEIEGDAVLFYREGDAPSAAVLLAQVQRMYVAFHTHLRRYDSHRICRCGACSTASGLKLKFVLHFGPTGKNRVKDHTKLFGRDVIVAHRLLKNDVPHDEYVLLTDDLVRACTDDLRQAAWAAPSEGAEGYDVGTISYCSIVLAPLRSQVPEPTVEDFSLPGLKRKVLTNGYVVEAPIDTVFDVVSDLSVRHQWTVGLLDSDRLNSRIPQHGSTHRCVMKKSESDPFIVSHDFEISDEFITFTDTEQRQGWCTVYTLHRIGPSATRIEVHTMLQKSLVKELLFSLFMKRALSRKIDASCENLNAYCKNLLAEGRQHTARVLLRPAASA